MRAIWPRRAGVAQLAERSLRKREVKGSTPFTGPMIDDTIDEIADDILNDPNRGYYDRQGNPISLKAWGDLQADKEATFLTNETINGFRIVVRFLGVAFEDQLLVAEHRPLAPRIFGMMVNGAEVLSHSEQQALARYAVVAEAAAKGGAALEEALKTMEEDRVQ